MSSFRLAVFLAYTGLLSSHLASQSAGAGSPASHPSRLLPDDSGGAWTAEQTEANRQVSAEAIERMRHAGLFRIMTPAIYGGYEYGFDALVPVVAQVAAGCGSSGWVFSLGVVHQWLVATMPKEAQDEYWSDPGAISGGSYPPVGKVVRVDGGYRLSGNWGFTSGCDHMQWLFLGGMVPPASEGRP